MSAEIIAIVISTVGIVAALAGGMFAGFIRMMRRMDEGFDRINAAFERFDENFANISEHLMAIGAQVGQLRTDLHEIEESGALLEGSRQQRAVPRCPRVSTLRAGMRPRNRPDVWMRHNAPLLRHCRT